MGFIGKLLVSLLVGLGTASLPLIGWVRAEKRATQLEISRDLALASQAGIQAALDEQNREVARLRAAGQEREQTLIRAQMAAAKARQDAAVQANHYLTVEVPTDCEPAIAWANEQAKTLSKGWRP